MMIQVPIPQPHLESIGKITANFAVLETPIAFFAWSLVSPADQRLGQIITAELSFRSLVALLSSVFKYKVTDLTALAEFQKLLNESGGYGEWLHAAEAHSSLNGDLLFFRIARQSIKSGNRIAVRSTNSKSGEELSAGSY